MQLNKIKPLTLGLLFCLALATLGAPSNTRPKKVITLFRHGARGPLYKVDDSHWENFKGKLTDAGKA